MPMKIEIVQETENKTLARKEIEFRVEHLGSTTPSRDDVRTKITAQFDADPSSVVIRSMHTKYGMGVTDGVARIYSDPEQMNKVELDHIIKRHESKKKE